MMHRPSYRGLTDTPRATAAPIPASFCAPLNQNFREHRRAAASRRVATSLAPLLDS